MATIQTTRLEFNKQDKGDKDWHTDLNAGLDKADELFFRQSSDYSGASSIGTPIVLVGASGLDPVMSGTYNGAFGDATILIEIDAGDPTNPNTFRWTKDFGASYEAQNVPCAIAPTVLAGIGVSVAWPTGVAGRATGELWSVALNDGQALNPKNIPLTPDYLGQRYVAEHTLPTRMVWWTAAGLTANDWLLDAQVSISANSVSSGAFPIALGHDGEWWFSLADKVLYYSNSGAWFPADGFQTGAIQDTINPNSPGGLWISCDGTTIGSNDSGADFVSPLAFNLFSLIWSLDATVHPLLDSVGAPAVRGGSALADWNLDSRITLPPNPGKVLAMADGSNAAGTEQGAEDVLLEERQTPDHGHMNYDDSSAITGAGTPQNVISFGLNGKGHGVDRDAGAQIPVPIIQPTYYTYRYIRL